MLLISYRFFAFLILANKIRDAKKQSSNSCQIDINCLNMLIIMTVFNQFLSI